MTGRMIEVRRKMLYVEEYGLTKKPPVLYLHGGPGEGCFDFTFHQSQKLKDDFRVIAIDQRGVCRSEGIEEDEAFSLLDMIEDCESLRDHLKIEKWSVIGHSFGGYLALLYVLKYPKSIDKVIFECPTFDFELTSRSLLKKTAIIANKYGNEDLATECHLLSQNIEKSPQQLTEDYLALSDELGDNRMEIYRYNNVNENDYYTEYTEEQWDEFYDRSEIHFNRLREEGKLFESLLGRIKEVNNPMLLLTAQFDAVTCEQQVEAFSKHSKSGSIYHFKKCGHTPHEELANEFKHVVVHFLGD